MSAATWTACVLACGLLATTGLRAQADAEDEARIGAQMQARLAAAPEAAPGTAVTIALAPPAPEPAPVIAEVIAPRAPPDAADDWLAPPSSRNAGLPFAELADWIGRQVAIVSVGERVHRGTVTAASAREVTLQVRRPGGSATYTLRREQVVRIDAR